MRAIGRGLSISSAYQPETLAVMLRAALATPPTPPTPPAKAPKPVAPVNIDEMTDAELFAYRKRTAPVEDLKFLMSFTMSDALRTRAEAIAKPTPKDCTALRNAWRIERQAAERAANEPAIGSERWFSEQGIRATADEAIALAEAA
jgi:hypothetical protein